MDERIQQAERLARIETLCEDMHTRLFGDGRPGVLESLDERVDHLERTEAKAKGALGVISALVTALFGTLVTHMVKGK